MSRFPSELYLIAIQKISMGRDSDSRIALLARIVASTFIIFALTLVPEIQSLGELYQDLECNEQTDEDDFWYETCNNIGDERKLETFRILTLFVGSFFLFGFSRNEETQVLTSDSVDIGAAMTLSGYSNNEDQKEEKIVTSQKVLSDEILPEGWGAYGNPPLPESGLPEGWTMEQWHHYGQQWLDSQK